MKINYFVYIINSNIKESFSALKFNLNFLKTRKKQNKLIKYLHYVQKKHRKTTNTHNQQIFYDGEIL